MASLIISTGVDEVPQDIKEVAGEYGFSKNFKDRACYHCAETAMGKERWVYWADGTWWISDRLGVLGGSAWVTSDAADVPEKGWQARTGWFGSGRPVSLTVVPKKMPIVEAAEIPQEASPMAKFSESLRKSTSSLKESLIAAHERFGSSAQKYAEVAKTRCKTAAFEVRDFVTHPDSVHCMRATVMGAKDVCIALGSCFLAFGYCLVEIAQDASKGMDSKEPMIPPKEPKEPDATQLQKEQGEYQAGAPAA